MPKSEEEKMCHAMFPPLYCVDVTRVGWGWASAEGKGEKIVRGESETPSIYPLFITFLSQTHTPNSLHIYWGWEWVDGKECVYFVGSVYQSRHFTFPPPPPPFSVIQHDSYNIQPPSTTPLIFPSLLLVVLLHYRWFQRVMQSDSWLKDLKGKIDDRRLRTREQWLSKGWEEGTLQVWRQPHKRVIAPRTRKGTRTKAGWIWERQEGFPD